MASHLSRCSCPDCVPVAITRRQPLPVIPLAYQEPAIEIVPPHSEDAVSQVFQAAAEAVAKLESLNVEPMTDIAWSPAQQCRRAL